MIRVLQVIGNMNAGGMETMIMNYYRNINRNKIQFDFLIFSKDKCLFEDEINFLGGHVYKVCSRRDNFFKNRVEVKKFFKNHHYDIAEFHQGITYFYPLKMAKKYCVKNRIIHNHGIDRAYLKKYKLYNELYAKNRISGLATHYFTCSKEIEPHLFSNKVIKNNKSILVNNAIDLEKYAYSKLYRDEIRNELKIKDSQILIGHVGTFTYPKNHLFLLDVFSELKKQNKKCKFLLVGKGPLKEEILNKINILNLSDDVIILEDRTDVNKIMSSLDYFVFPSLFEGIPLVLIEAQTSGLPIVMSDTINLKSVVTDNVKILPLSDGAFKWADSILNKKQVNSANREKYFKLVQKTNYNIFNEAKKLEKIYVDIFKNKL